MLHYNTSTRKIAAIGPSLLKLDFVFSFSPNVSVATIEAINFAIFELQIDTSSPYQSLIDTHFNATAAQLYEATQQQKLRPYFTLIVSGSLIGLYLVFVGIWALVKHYKRKERLNSHKTGENIIEQEQG